MKILEPRTLVKGNQSTSYAPILASSVGLSFWGGLNPETGIIIDESHPLVGKSVTNCILCLPSGRGSCTASQVLLELILNNKAPKAIVLRDIDPLICVGAIIADEVFNVRQNSQPAQLLSIVQVGEEQFDHILQASDYTQSRLYGRVVGETLEILLKEEVATAVNSVALEQDNSSHKQAICLNDDEKQWINAAKNDAERMALTVLFRYARISNSDSPTYTSVSSAHIVSITIVARRIVQRSCV